MFEGIVLTEAEFERADVDEVEEDVDELVDNWAPNRIFNKLKIKYFYT